VVNFASLFANRRKTYVHQPKVCSEEKLEVVQEENPLNAIHEEAPVKKINNVSMTHFESLFANRRVPNDNSGIIASSTLL
jgi:hypothetical protein